MSLRTGNAPELARVLLSAFVKGPPPAAVSTELADFLWNSGNFAEAMPLNLGIELLQTGKAGAFVYHQKTGMLFTHVRAHPMLMAYLASLHRIDFSAENNTWEFDQGMGFDATSKLADEFIDKGIGLYRSTLHSADTIMVDGVFDWSPAERNAFQDFRQFRF